MDEIVDQVAAMRDSNGNKKSWKAQWKLQFQELVVHFQTLESRHMYNLHLYTEISIICLPLFCISFLKASVRPFKLFLNKNFTRSKSTMELLEKGVQYV